ncbi:response regulator transcription factor [Bacillus amyloliquefaciens]|uniref:response regulator transcription factor n=1 Tax=Bacillus amyloliquefaciens TaxID=1390 RepID=UPI000E2475B9|nr:response regulator transcription factor [Bacillus amyloliquefaciens]RDY90257.1 DNA-binding response regulator [Bacillus amyloliquefaciens]
MDKLKGIKVLIVDDEPAIIDFLTMGLVNEGFEVMSAADGMSAMNLVKAFQPHIAVLDVMMPGMDGLELSRMLKKTSNTAVIMLTAKDEAELRVKALIEGAVDYMIKPFSFEELLARIYARIPNRFPHLFDEVVLSPIRIDDRSREIHYNEQSLKLSATEYELLKFLVLRRTVLSKTRILDQVWGYGFYKEHKVIRTVLGPGYRVDVA